jgi:hypothetical protein
VTNRRGPPRRTSRTLRGAADHHLDPRSSAAAASSRCRP